ncbi:MAG: MATE family efflux transporter [Bacteroidales bacterium]|nr:MATE family efflux transporter [Bacteroidales bacterium]
MYDNRDQIDLGNGEIGRLFASLFVPTLLGMLFNMAFIFTDGIFVGHGIGGHGLAAINLVGPMMMFINGLGMMLGMGASVVAAIHLSHGNVKAARINVTQAFVTGISCSLLMAAVCYLMPDTVLRLLGATGALYPYAREYYLWFMPTCLLNMVTSIGMFAIRLDGSPRYAMLSNIVPAIVNGVLDYIFIFPLQWGLMGASLATDIGGLVGTVMVLHYMLFRTNTLRPYRLKATSTSLRLMLRNVGYMVRTGLSGFVGEIAVGAMMLTGNWVFKQHLGDQGVAAYSVTCYLFPLVYMVYNAVAASAQPILSFNYGKGDRQRVHHTLLFGLIVSIALGLAVSALFYFFAPSVVSCFLSTSAPAYDLAAKGLPYYASGFVFMAINICVVGYLQSVERSGLAIIYTLMRGVVLLVAAFMVLPQVMGVPGLWLSVPAAEALTTVGVLIFVIKNRRGAQLNEGSSY